MCSVHRAIPAGASRACRRRAGSALGHARWRRRCRSAPPSRLALAGRDAAVSVACCWLGSDLTKSPANRGSLSNSGEGRGRSADSIEPTGIELVTGRRVAIDPGRALTPAIGVRSCAQASGAHAGHHAGTAYGANRDRTGDLPLAKSQRERAAAGRISVSPADRADRKVRLRTPGGSYLGS